MAILEPELAILDETDSGLDIDALRIVAQGIREVRADRPSMGVVLITHYQRLLDEVAPDHIHILVDGRIVATGGMELAEQLERDGYEAFQADGRAPRAGRRSPELSTMTLDVATIRKEFPILDREIDGAPIVYLDSGNTSQKPRQVIDAMTTLPRARRTRRSTAAPTASPPRPPTPTRAPRSQGRPLHQRAERRRGRVHQERHRGAQPRRPVVGSRQPAAQATSCVLTAHGAPRQHRAVAHARRPSAASSCAGSRSPPTASSTSTDLAACSTAPRCSSFTAMSNVLGTLTPVAELCRRRPRRRRAGDRRRLPVRAAQRHRRAGVGRRLRRLLQPQDVRAVGHRRAVGPRWSCSTRCRRSSAAAT